MKKIVTACILLLLWFVAPAQRKTLDSLLTKIDNAGDTADISALLPKVHILPGDDMAILNKSKADFQKAETSGQLEKQNKALMVISLVAGEMHNEPLLLDATLKGVSISSKAKDLVYLKDFLSSAAGIYAKQGSFNKAVNYYLPASKTAMALKDTDEAIDIYAGLELAYLHLNKPDSAHFFAGKAIPVLLDHLDATSDLNRITKLFGQIFKQADGRQALLNYANKRLSDAEQHNNEADEEKPLIAIAILDNTKNNSVGALETSLHGLSISGKLKDHVPQIFFLNLIGSIYENENDFTRTVNYLHLQLQNAVLIRDTAQMLATYSVIVSDYYNLHRNDSAYFFVEKEYKLVNKVRKNSKSYTPFMLMSVYNDLVEVFMRMGKTDSALFYHHFALPLDLRYARPNDLNYYEYNAASAFFQKKEVDSAGKYATDSYRGSGAQRDFSTQELAAVLLAKLYEGRDNLKSIFYYKADKAAIDSLNAGDMARQFQVVADTQLQQEQELRNAETEYQNRLKFYALAGILVLVLLVSGILWNSNKKQKKANRQLALQKTQIQQTLQELETTQTQLIQREKMASLGELTAGIAHEIQNPMNFVNNFSEVNTELIQEMQEEIGKGNYDEVKTIADDLKINQQKISHHGKRADFIVKGMLEHSRASTGERQPTKLNVLCDEFMKLSYHGLRAKDKNFNAELITHFDETLPKANVSQQDIDRVMLNLFNNAFYDVNQKLKTAGPDYKPEVSVTTLSENGIVVIRVKDNGGGIPDAIKDKIMQPFFTTKPTGEGTGLGLSLSYDIVVKGHGGKIGVESKEGEGSEFIIQMPIEKIS